MSETRHDCYHLPEYAELAAAEEGAIPMAFYAEEGSAACLIPLLIRPLPAGLNAPMDWFDCISPYGYSGILMSASQEKVRSFLDAFRCAALARGLVSAFLRLHPLFPLDPGVLGKFGRMMRHGRTVYIDVAQTKEQVWRQMSANHRRNITRLLRSGFYACFDDWSRLPDFITVYHSTMRRVGAAAAYFFPRRYFEALREKLGQRVHLACVLSERNELAAAGLFIATEEIVQYHLGGTAEEYLSVAPSKLMLDCVCRWALEGTHDVFHLGGGVGGAEDSLFHFKAGFSSLRGDFSTYRLVFDETKHAWLNQAAQVVAASGAGANVDFFPAYRRRQGCDHEP